MSDLTDRARLMAEESDDWSIIRQLADRVDFLERDQERNLTQLADKDAANDDTIAALSTPEGHALLSAFPSWKAADQ